MSFFRTSSVADVTRGGQTLMHFIRMIIQVALRFLWLIGLTLCITVVTYYLTHTIEYERYVVFRWLVSWFSMNILPIGDTYVPFDLADGRTLQVRVATLVADPYMLRVLNEHVRIVIAAVIIALLISLALYTLIFRFIHRTGTDMRQEVFLRGQRLVDTPTLRNLLRKAGMASDLKIGHIPLVKGSETSNILVTGSPGSGKSVAIRDLLKQIRKRGDRAIVYSTAGEFIETFYRPGKDVVLNPLDARCPAWHIWAEARTPPDFDNLAASLIPEQPNGGDPFWVLAARTLFATVGMKMKTRGDYSTRRLLQDLLTIKLSEVAELVKGTEGAALVAEGGEKLAISVRATLAAYIRSLKFLRSDGPVFSIRDWVHKRTDDSWIFISSRSEHDATLRPLITTWLDIATSAILSLRPDMQRRIWVVIDELPSLNKLPSLLKLLPQGRKYGGCCVVGFQSYAQLQYIYGPKEAETITGLFDTWVSYRANDPATAQWASTAYGSAEYMETNEGISYGANDMRDGVNLAMRRETRVLIMPTEFMQLPNLTGYLRLQGSYPSAKFTAEYKAFKVVAPAFVEGELAPGSWDFSDVEPAPSVGVPVQVPIFSVPPVTPFRERVFTDDDDADNDRFHHI